ncbi:DeoR/GlpR family DNA-binding transcription regulator [Alkalibaculum bacchi]|uniref:DeoR/GlpR family DNA-binding transcription regulator n=1 Tax=Alkalibaculum bacchi TaxID=645887 RepID=UPI0016525A20|nr:DeoR/GlpR family DNA-binding transcription regulator [Alkalibaculum bacchi]
MGLERKNYILSELDLKKILKINEVAQVLKASPSTIRRDFEELANEGLADKIRGGIAKKNYETDVFRLEKGQSPKDSTAEIKRRLCHMVAQEIQDGQCVFVDGGTTFAYLMEFVQEKKIKIITHNTLLIEKLPPVKPEIILLGGNFSQEFCVNTGQITLEDMKRFQFDYALIGCEGMSLEENATYAADIHIVAPKQLAIERAATRFLILDETKINKRGFMKFATLDQFDKIFIDNGTQIKRIHADVVEFKGND